MARNPARAFQPRLALSPVHQRTGDGKGQPSSRWNAPWCAFARIAKPGRKLKLRVLQTTAPNPEDGLAGLIERVTFHNEETGFAVLRVKVKGRRELATVVGSLASVSAGEWITAQGRWVRDSEHGLQLNATFLECTPPTSREGTEKYLGSGMIKGIGPVYAKKMVDRFGEEIFTIIAESSARLE